MYKTRGPSAIPDIIFATLIMLCAIMYGCSGEATISTKAKTSSEPNEIKIVSDQPDRLNAGGATTDSSDTTRMKFTTARIRLEKDYSIVAVTGSNLYIVGSDLEGLVHITDEWRRIASFNRREIVSVILAP